MSCSTTMCFIVKTLLLINFLGKFNVQSFPTNSVENDEPGDKGTINGSTYWDIGRIICCTQIIRTCTGDGLWITILIGITCSSHDLYSGRLNISITPTGI